MVNPDKNLLNRVSYAELEGLVKEAKAEAGRTDLFYLNQEILGHKDVTKEVYGELINLLVNGTKNTLIIMPRGSLKSEIVESYMIQRILQDPNIRILYILESKQKAIDYLKGLKDHLESEKFQAIYGDIRDLSVWREDCIRVKGRTVNAKEHTVFCGSLESSTGLTGKHPTLIVADDLHSLLNTRTEHQVGSAKEVFTELVNLGMDGARQIVVGTYWVNNDIYNTITRSVTDKPFSEIHKVRLLENDYWSIYVRSAIEPCDNGETIEIPGFGVFENSRVSFPKVGLKLLIEKWSQPTMTRYVFSCQQLCNPEESMNSEFSKEELDDATGVDWERVKDKKLVRSMLLLDPAYSTSCSSDYSAFTYCGYTDDGTLKIELSLREKVEPDKLVEQVFAMRMAYRPHIVGIESNSTQILGKWIKDKRAEKGQYFKIVEIKTPHNSKILRIRALKALFKTHKIAINPECIDLLNEFKEFPTSKKDDLIDCVSFVLNEALHNPNYQDKPVVRPKSGPWKSLPGYKPIGS